MYLFVLWFPISWTIRVMDIDSRHEDKEYFVFITSVMHLLIIMGSLFGFITSRITYIEFETKATLLIFMPFSLFYQLGKQDSRQRERGWFSLVSV